MECRLAEVPEAWSEIRLASSLKVERENPFNPASSIPHFSLGFPRIDSLLRPFLPGRLTVFSGDESPMVAELAAFRAQLPIEAGGLDSAVLLVDGGNRPDFTPALAKLRHIGPTAMRRVFVHRVFTLYQLTDFVSNHLSRAAEDCGTRLVIISDMLGVFNEPELEEREARRMLGAIEEGIRRIKKNAFIIVTSAAPNKYDGVVASWADTAVYLSSSSGTVQAKLLKHRNRLPTASSFKLSQLLGTIG